MAEQTTKEHKAQQAIESKINSLLKDRLKLLQKIERSLSKQEAIAQKLKAAMAEGCEQQGTEEGFNDAADAADNLASASKRAGDQSSISAAMIKAGMKESAGATRGLGSAFKTVGKGAMVFGGIAAGAASLVTGAFSGVLSIISSVAGVIKSAVGAMWSLAKSIIALPFNLLDGLIEMGNELMGIGLDIARSWEDVRDVFGDLSTTVGADIRSTVMNLRMIGDTGLDAYQVLGTMSQRIEAVSKLYQGLGGAVALFSEEIKNSNGAVIAFQRGLGFTEEQLQGVATVAMSSGKSLVEVQTEIANQAIQLGATFGIPKKLIGKDVAEMINDIDTFGNMTVKQMAKTSVYAKKLGVDVKKMAGVFKAFNNFEDAAIGAAKLSQAFGMNIDVVKQLKAGSPAEVIEDLRTAFFNAGKDAANLNRHELALLATQSGLDQETAKRVFSLENQGVAYEDIANKADDAESAQLTAANAMKQVAKDIKKIVHEVLKMDGAFAEFRKGFEQGFTIMNPMFMKLVKTARNVGFTMRGMGQQFAKAILQLKPVKKIFKGLNKFLEKFGGLLTNVAGQFVKWASSLGKNAKNAGKQLVDGLSDALTGFLSDPEVAGALNDIKTGIADIAILILETLSGIIPQAMQKLTNLFDSGTEYLRNPDKLNIPSMAPKWVASLKGLFDGIKAKGGPLIDSMMDFFREVFKGDWLDKMGITDMVTKVGRTLVRAIADSLKGTSLGKYLEVDKITKRMDAEDRKQEKFATARKKREGDFRVMQGKNEKVFQAFSERARKKTLTTALGAAQQEIRAKTGIQDAEIGIGNIRQKQTEEGIKTTLKLNSENKKHQDIATKLFQQKKISWKQLDAFRKGREDSGFDIFGGNVQKAFKTHEQNVRNINEIGKARKKLAGKQRGAFEDGEQSRKSAEKSVIEGTRAGHAMADSGILGTLAFDYTPEAEAVGKGRAAADYLRSLDNEATSNLQRKQKIEQSLESYMTKAPPKAQVIRLPEVTITAREAAKKADKDLQKTKAHAKSFQTQAENFRAVNEGVTKGINDSNKAAKKLVTTVKPVLTRDGTIADQKTLTIKTPKEIINLSLNVSMDAKQVGNGLLGVELKDGKKLAIQ